MKVHVLQHVPFEGLGSIQSWLDAKKATISYSRFFDTLQLPALDAIDLIIIMGGPMSANDADTLSWLAPEKEFIREAVGRNIPILGICLGAQLIAAAMGARVYRNPVREIGWFPVRAVPSPPGCFQFPKEYLAFHWHGETFDLPEGAARLAENEACANQAFQLGPNVIGLQFHLETTPASASALLDNCRDDLIVTGPFVQGATELRMAPSSSYQTINKVMDRLLSYLTADIPG